MGDNSRSVGSEYKTLGVVGAIYAITLVVAVLCSGMLPPYWSSSKISSTLDANSRQENSWQFIGKSKGISTFIRKEAGSKLLAFKGAATFDFHISQVLAVFGDVASTVQWVDMLAEMHSFPPLSNPKSVTDIFNGDVKDFSVQSNPLLGAKRNWMKKSSSIHDIVYQYYALPWPLSHRDFVFKRSFEFQEKERLVMAYYSSVEDGRLPANSLHPMSIRAESPYTNWHFQNAADFCSGLAAQKESAQTDSKNDPHQLFETFCSRDANQLRQSTFIEIESLVDNKGSIPAWFINYMQRSWPVKTLDALRMYIAKNKNKFKPLPLLEKW